MKKRLLVFCVLLSFGSFQAAIAQNSLLVHNHNKLALELFSRATLPGKNTIISPLALYSGFGILYMGSSGATDRELQSNLYFDSEKPRFVRNLMKMVQEVNKTNYRGINIQSNNSFWKQKDYNISKTYEGLFKGELKTEEREINFNAERDSLKFTFGDYLNGQTNGKISGYTSDGITDSSNKALIFSSLYFYGTWATEFDASLTSSAKFHVDEKNTVDADFMSQAGSFNYFESEKYKYIEIPYAGKAASMIIILPQIKNADIDFSDYERAMSESTPQMMDLTLPRFSFSAEIKLKNLFSSTGLDSVFVDGANLSGISTDRQLKVNDILHGAFVEVNEKGTEASAVNTIKLNRKASEVSNGTFKADQPFIFIIKENNLNTILFIGRIANPNE